ncbi:hypothetical protein [Micromonospora sp. WMMD987]|uniref:hypothetical protein n=1 Tax=Micromonospora sp. WMMD987 TaxID=3016089 RepID=UPI00249CDCE5|nr:hypothetical protein [Micromonospora sp. WMMD987]WFE94798.1 hypothetical protein O7612_26300 [Micromonospora sp. WMMD987]
MAFRTWGRLLLTALGVSMLAGAGQLGIAYGFGIVRLTGDFPDVNRWLAQLAWVGWFAATAAVVGAVLTGRLARREGLPGTTPVHLAISGVAALGALVVAPLCMQPARAAELGGVDPVRAVGICAVAGAVVGAGAAAAVLLRPPLGGNVALLAGAVWLLASISAAPGVLSTGPLRTVRLGVLEPTWLGPDRARWLAPVVLPVVALVAGAVTGGLARRRGHVPLIGGATGAAGPMLLAFAYLTAGPGDPADRYQLAPYYGALIAVVAGALGSTTAALVRWPLLPARPAAGDRDGVIEPTDILAPLPAVPGPTRATTEGTVPAGAMAEGSVPAAALADEPVTVDLGVVGRSVDSGSSGPAGTPAHWDWPDPAATVTDRPTIRPAPAPASAPAPAPASSPAPASALTPPPVSAPAPAPTGGPLSTPAPAPTGLSRAESTSTEPTPATPARTKRTPPGSARSVPTPAVSEPARPEPTPAEPSPSGSARTGSARTGSARTGSARTKDATAGQGQAASPASGDEPAPASRPRRATAATAGTPAGSTERTAPTSAAGGGDTDGDRPAATRSGPATPTDADETVGRRSAATRSGPTARSAPTGAAAPDSTGPDSAPSMPAAVPTAGAVPPVAGLRHVTPDGVEGMPRPRHQLPDLSGTGGPVDADHPGPPRAALPFPEPDTTGRTETPGPVNLRWEASTSPADTPPAGKPAAPDSVDTMPTDSDDRKIAGKTKGRRGLFRRNRPTEVEQADDRTAAQATPDDEYVDWVAGLSKPLADNEPERESGRRSLRTSGRHHRD